MKVELVVGIIGLIVAALAIGVAGQTMMNVNEIRDEVTANKSNLEFVMKQEPSALYDDSNMLQKFADIELEMVNMKAEYTKEIVATRKLLQNAQLGTGDAQRDKLDEQTGTGTSPILTISIDSNEFIRGEIIWISGTGEPLQPIQATISDPNLGKRYPNASVDKNGSYKIAYTTDFDSLLGTYNMYVKSKGETSQTLSFVLKE